MRAIVCLYVLQTVNVFFYGTIASFSNSNTYYCPLAELCAMSEYRIYPGNGKLMVRRDGKPIYLGSSKAQSLTLQRKKPAKLMWTQAWRRLHKKGLSEANLKKRRTRTNKVQRAIVGLSLDDIKKKAAQKPEFRSAQRDAVLKEVKDRKKTTTTKVKSKAAAAAGGVRAPKVPKNVKRR
jgi:large subunit ribosomal protein L24e